MKKSLLGTYFVRGYLAVPIFKVGEKFTYFLKGYLTPFYGLKKRAPNTRKKLCEMGPKWPDYLAPSPKYPHVKLCEPHILGSWHFMGIWRGVPGIWRFWTGVGLQCGNARLI